VSSVKSAIILFATIAPHKSEIFKPIQIVVF
jgi:hypothetical protein